MTVAAEHGEPASLFARMALGEYEQVVFCHDAAVGLKSIIAIHDTTLGPALGGVRMYPYPNEQEALEDCLRLARNMTYKAAAAGVHLGGGKRVIIGDPAIHKTEALLRVHGRFIQTLGGRYIPGIDIGTEQADMEIIGLEAERVSCTGRDPSYYTALGVLAAIRSALTDAYGSPALDARRIAVQGVGHVGAHLVDLVANAGATVVIADVEPARTKATAARVSAEIVGPDEILAVPCDVLAPCARGGVIGAASIDRLACRVIVGAANNVLADADDASALAERGITYIPDYYASAGGLIFLEEDMLAHDQARTELRVSSIADRVTEVLRRARERTISTVQAGDELAEERLESLRHVSPRYVARPARERTPR